MRNEKEVLTSEGLPVGLDLLGDSASRHPGTCAPPRHLPTYPGGLILLTFWQNGPIAISILRQDRRWTPATLHLCNDQESAIRQSALARLGVKGKLHGRISLAWKESSRLAPGHQGRDVL